jgi:predicted transglutaminase-like protease
LARKGRFNSELLSNEDEMNIRQSLNKILARLTNPSIDSETYCPTSDEIKNNDVKRLANRLTAASYRETLTNILEWQERNITFWIERYLLVIVFYYSVIALFFGVLILTILTITSILSLSFYWWFVVNWWVIWASCIATTLAIMILILNSNRKFPWKEVPKGLMNAFMPSISMDFLLEKKLGVCRDYAKLTACLLSNIYPDKEIYFATAPSHAATGMKIGNELYMLDQRLPIVTKDRWNDYRKPRWYHTIKRFDPAKITLQKADKRAFIHTEDKPVLNTEKLSKRMTELLNIKEQSDDKTISSQKPIPIRWKNGAILYEENEMTDYSLARYLETKISSEIVKMNQITKIEISREKNDLMFQIHVSKSLNGLAAH